MQVVVIVGTPRVAHNRGFRIAPASPTVDSDSFNTEFQAGLVLLTAAIQNLERVRARGAPQISADLQQQQQLLDSALWQFQRALSAGQR